MTQSVVIRTGDSSAWVNQRDTDFLLGNAGLLFGVDVSGYSNAIFNAFTGDQFGSSASTFGITTGWSDALGSVYSIDTGRHLSTIGFSNNTFQKNRNLRLIGHYIGYSRLVFNGEVIAPPPPVPTPVPASVVLFGFGLMVLGAVRRRR